MAIKSGADRITDIFGERGVSLTKTESRLLDLLLGRERIVNTEEIEEGLWGEDPDGGPLTAHRVIDVHTCRLRKKIKAAGIPWQLVTLCGRGIQLRYLNK